VSPIATLAILRAMAAAIDHAHAAGLVHGNLAPAQVLLTAGDRPLVSDFGLASLRRPVVDGLAIGVHDGTPEYLAPEQIMGAEPAGASDRYAFAAIAYQLLVDRTPFEGEPQAVLNAHLHAEPVAPSTRNRALPPPVDPVLLRGLAKEQPNRWPTCGQLVDALAEALGVIPARAEPSRGGRRWPLVIAGALLATALGALAGVLATGHAW
jgi:serine/threonine-protein kinase